MVRMAAILADRSSGPRRAVRAQSVMGGTPEEDDTRLAAPGGRRLRSSEGGSKGQPRGPMLLTYRTPGRGVGRMRGGCQTEHDPSQWCWWMRRASTGEVLFEGIPVQLWQVFGSPKEVTFWAAQTKWFATAGAFGVRRSWMPSGAGLRPSKTSSRQREPVSARAARSSIPRPSAATGIFWPSSRRSWLPRAIRPAVAAGRNKAKGRVLGGRLRHQPIAAGCSVATAQPEANRTRTADRRPKHPRAA